jgi:hypothetical protein
MPRHLLNSSFEDYAYKIKLSNGCRDKLSQPYTVAFQSEHRKKDAGLLKMGCSNKPLFY